ncbi:MAG TPA: heparinase II/III family protein [bacterium]|nr:heparinase II/III family protein [bacterium]
MRKLRPFLIILVLLASAQAFAAAPPTGPWHADITEHPRLLFFADDLSTIAGRLDREPYVTLMTRVRSRANASYNAIFEPYDAGREYSNANIAIAAAFVAWIDDDATMADKAATILELMGYEFPNPIYIYKQDIHIAEALMNYAVAYDIIAGTGLIEPTRLTAIATRVTTMVENLYADFFDTLAIWQPFSTNNHSIKICSALAIAAMTFNQHDDANKWFNLGMTETVYKLFDVQIVEGAMAEGPYYAAYSAVNHLPFFVMYNHLVGEDATLLQRDFCLIGPNCTWSEVEVVNPVDNPKLYDQSEWIVKIRLPNGASPPIDDSNSEGFFNGLMAPVWGDGLLAWEWLTSPAYPMFTQHCADTLVHIVATYDDEVTLTPPDGWFGPNFLMYDAGEAVFRSGWGEDDSWMLFLAENGQARTAGAGHEHGDNLSVSLYARGESLLLDPGYIKWEEHAVVMLGKHHNVPTVDGNAPPAPNPVILIGGNDAFIVDGMTDAAAPFVTGQSAWNDAQFERTVFFPDSDYLIAVDDMSADENHTYGVLWHGNGGGDSGYPFTLLADGGSWQPEDAGVDVHVNSSIGDVALDTSINIHAFTYGQMIEHVSLSAQVDTQAKRARIVSVATPYNLTKETPRTVTWDAMDAAIAARIEGTDTDFLFAQDVRRVRNLTAAQTGSVDVSTSARTLLLRTDATASAGHAYVDGGHYLALGERQVWQFGYDRRVWVDWSGDAWTFSVGPEGGMVAAFLSAMPDIDADPGVKWIYQNKMLRIWAPADASFTVTLD